MACHPNLSAPLLLSGQTSFQDRKIEEERLDQISQLTKSYFRRPLPEHLVSFTSPDGRVLFKEALEAGTLENYFHLAGNFTTQTETACTLELWIYSVIFKTLM